jgi:hypothetical protein
MSAFNSSSETAMLHESMMWTWQTCHQRLHLLADLLDRRALDDRQLVGFDAHLRLSERRVVLLLDVVVGHRQTHRLSLSSHAQSGERLGRVVAAVEASPPADRHSAAHGHVQLQRACGDARDDLVVAATPDRVAVLLVDLGNDLVVVVRPYAHHASICSS